MACRPQVCLCESLQTTESGTDRPLGFCLWVALFVSRAASFALAAHALLCFAHLVVLTCELSTACLQCMGPQQRQESAHHHGMFQCASWWWRWHIRHCIKRPASSQGL
jgi:hypothetical protein